MQSSRYEWPRNDYLTHIKSCGLCQVNRVGLDNSGRKIELDHDTISFICPIAMSFLLEIQSLI